MERNALHRERRFVVSPALPADPPGNSLVWNTLAIVLVSLAILAVLGLLIAVMTSAVHLG